jgi:hypothetical protein
MFRKYFDLLVGGSNRDWKFYDFIGFDFGFGQK